MILLLFIFLFAFIALSIPISFSIGLATTIVGFINGNFPLVILPQKIFTALDSFPILALPLFILAGNLLDTGGVGRRLINLANVLVRHITGGLGMVVIISTIFFSEISGSSAADTAAIGSVTIPAMRRLKYDSAFATAIVAASGGMAALIPPSIIGIIYGWQASCSIGAIFAGGFLPGFIMGAILCVYTYFYAKKKNFPTENKASLKDVWFAFKEALLALIMPIIILGGIFGGIFTATEAASVAVFYGLAVALFHYREIRIRDIPKILVDSAVTTGYVTLLLGFASSFAYFITIEQVPVKLADFIVSVSGSKWVFLLLVDAVFLIGGLFLNATALLIILVPIFLPIAQNFGIDVIHFGIVLISALSIGYVTPPVGIVLYVACSISKVPLSAVIRPLSPYLFLMCVMLMFTTFFPWISLVVPNMLFGN